MKKRRPLFLIASIIQRQQAEAARPVLTLSTKKSERGRFRIKVTDPKDATGKALLVSPSGYGSDKKAHDVIERICGSRLEVAE